jgi:hypothetical protein
MTDGDITLSGTVFTNSDLTIVAENIEFSGTANVARDAMLRANATASLDGQLSGGRDMILEGFGSLSIQEGGLVEAGNVINVQTEGHALSNGSFQAASELRVQAGNIIISESGFGAERRQP